MKVDTLTFDDSAKQLTLKDDASDKLDFSYEDVSKLFFEVTLHIRGGALSQIIR